MSAKPSDMPFQKLASVRQADPVDESLREVDACMTDFIGPRWRDHLTPDNAIDLTAITLNNVLEDDK